MAKTKTKAYFYGRGRRKTATARVRLYTSKQDFTSTVNNKPLDEYFNRAAQQKVVSAPLNLAGVDNSVLSVKVNGGGKNAQADAVQLGIARALIEVDKDLRPTLKKAGFLTRDPREKERKKYGLKRARKSPQWSKR